MILLRAWWLFFPTFAVILYVFTYSHIFSSLGYSQIISKVNVEDTSPVRVLAVYSPFYYQTMQDNGTGFSDHSYLKSLTRNKFGIPIIRPAERNGAGPSFYNQESLGHRRWQGQLAKHYGIDGFVMMHYWSSSHALLDLPLHLRLKDGFPNISFCLMWSNDHFHRKNGLLFKSDHAAENKSDWIMHIQYLIPAISHPDYILVNGGPLFMIQSNADIHILSAMITEWNRYLTKHTSMKEMYAVYMVTSTDSLNSIISPPSGFQALAEFYPYLSGGSIWPTAKILSTGLSDVLRDVPYILGISTAVDNSPRQAGAATVQPSHPSLFRHILHHQIHRSRTGIVIANAWNDWGEGAALEPSVEWGRAWLENVKRAKLQKPNLQLQNGLPHRLSLRNAGVQDGNYAENQDRICIIVRTFHGHALGLYNVHLFISSLQTTSNSHWDAFFLDTDVRSHPFVLLPSILRSYNDSRLRFAEIPTNFQNPYNSSMSAYDLVDWAIYNSCSHDNYGFLLVTNADNWYAPDAFNMLPTKQTNLIVMNFYGRYNVIADVIFGSKSGMDNCCIRLNNKDCFLASPKVSFIDLGAVIFDLTKFREESRAFTPFTGVCGGACHDGALLQSLTETHGWTWKGHDIGVCALYHNPSPQSCSIVGGVYFDTLNGNSAGCYDISDLPIPWSDVNWDNFMKSHEACVCAKGPM